MTVLINDIVGSEKLHNNTIRYNHKVVVLNSEEDFVCKRLTAQEAMARTKEKFKNTLNYLS